MPTCLRGCLPRFHEALCDLVFGLRMLDGLVFSRHMCQELGIEEGGHVMWKADVQVAHRHIVVGLSKLEGCLPVSDDTTLSLHIHTSRSVRRSVTWCLHFTNWSIMVNKPDDSVVCDGIGCLASNASTDKW